MRSSPTIAKEISVRTPRLSSTGSAAFMRFSVWVNDYHLMLVPDMLRKALPNAAIGFFLHVAFPSSEIFRCLSVREHLLRGLLASDLISFQTPNFARHFRLGTASRVYPRRH